MLDANLEPQPIGIPGELCIGGAGVARGYLNRPELTARAIRPGPVSRRAWRAHVPHRRSRPLAGGRHDRVHRAQRPPAQDPRLPDRARARSRPCSSATRAFAPPPSPTGEDDSGTPRLVAYLVPTDQGDPAAPDELRAFAAEQLPAYMIPSAWVPLAELPSTPNGKATWMPCPIRTSTARRRPASSCAARTRARSELVEIWREILDVERDRHQPTTSSRSAATRCLPSASSRRSRTVRCAFAARGAVPKRNDRRDGEDGRRANADRRVRKHGHPWSRCNRAANAPRSS